MANRKPVAIVVVGLAIIAAGAMLLQRTMRNASPAPKGVPVTILDKKANRSPAKPRQAIAKKTPTAPEAMVPEDDVSTATVEPVVAPAAPAAKPDQKTAALADPEGFVHNLTDEQASELYMLLRVERGIAEMNVRKRELLMDTKLGYLRLATPELALSETQKQLVAQIRDGLKPKMEAQMAEAWAAQDALGRRLWETTTGAKTQEEQFRNFQRAEWFQNQYAEQMRKMDELKKPLNEEFEAAVRPVLTPEQRKLLDDTYGPQGGTP